MLVLNNNMVKRTLFVVCIPDTSCDYTACLLSLSLDALC